MQNRPNQPPQAAEIASKQAAKLKAVSKHCPSQRGKFERAYGGKSLRAAVDAMCVECMGFQPYQIEGCTCLACPLYGYRRAAR